MRLGDNDESYVEDRRGQGGFGGGMRLGLGGSLVLLVLSLLFGRNFFALVGNQRGPAPGPPAGSPAAERRIAGEEGLKRIAVEAFNDAQHFWTEEFAQRGRGEYRPARLVLFWDATRSGCGGASAEMGPFYCPSDEKVYIDLGFYRELARRFGAPGDFAQAYVIAHELGHHVQDLLGTEARVRRLQQQRPGRVNDLSVRMELQADCYAGVWGHSAAERRLLDPGDVEDGLRAAAAVGDDRIQRAAQGYVSPETFTHGSAAQRSHWFRRGLQSGRPQDCDTFAVPGP